MGDQHQNLMSFVRIGGRTLPYGRGEKAQACAEHDRVDTTAEESTIRKEIDALQNSNSELHLEIEALKRGKTSLEQKFENGLGAEFDFGRRYYQCKREAPGVGYRNTPSFGDKVMPGHTQLTHAQNSD